VTPSLLIEIPWDPNITRIGGLLLTWHGLFTAIGILVGVQIALRFSRIVGFDEDDMYTIALVGVPAGIVGSRALFVIENWDRFSQEPGQIIQITEGGITIWGGVVAGALAGILFAAWRRYPIRSGMDAAIFGMIPGMQIGRIGDLINGEHLSKTTDLPWAVVYTDPDSPAFAHSIAFGPHHPTTTYEMLIVVTLLLIVAWLFFRTLYRYPGLSFATLAIGYSITRILLTYLRLDSPEFAFGLRTPQLVGLFTIAVLLPFVVRWLRQGPADIEPPRPPGRIPIARTEARR